MKPRIVATGRLILPNTDLARTHGWQHGLPLEEKIHIDMSRTAAPDAVGEVGRLCVEKGWRSTPALLELCYALCVESLAHGVKYWISAANMECDSVDEALILYRALDREGLVRRDIDAIVRVRREREGLSRFTFFKSDEERQRAASGSGKVRLPKAVAADAMLGARYVGEPLWDDHFGVYSMPLVAEVEEVAAVVRRLRRPKIRRSDDRAS